jgi:PAS domain S-box-containing protein
MPTPLSVLIVEDSADDAALVLREFERGGYGVKFERVATAEAMRAALDRQPWDVIVSEYATPSFSGLDALGIVRERALDVPFIVVSAKTGEEWAVEMMRAGAHDYLMKGSLVRLLPAIQRELGDARVRRERKNTEEALIESEQRKAAVLESALDCFIAMNHEGRILEFNSAAEKTFGYRREEAVGQLLGDLIVPPELRERHQRGLAHYLETGEGPVLGKRIEMPALRADGTRIPVELSITAIRKGKQALFTGCLRDITDRKRSEEAQRESEQRFRATFDQAAVGIAHVAADGKWLRVNQKLCDIVGYTREELLRLTFQDITYPPDLDADLALAARVLCGEIENYSMEKRYIRKDGSLIWINLTVSLVRDIAGAPKYFIAVIDDISARKHAEEQLLRAHEELEARVQERTAQLRAASVAKDRFVANMSHELRTPLNSIIGFSEFLSDGKPGPLNVKQKEYLDDILNSAHHLLHLINDVLDLAKVEAGRMELNPELFSVEKAINEVCAGARAIAEKKRIAIDVRVAREVESVTLDPQKFKQVLYNLLSNAVKFTDEGGRVAINVAPLDAERFKLEIADTGIGIRREELGRLFREFERLDSAASRHCEGTGLGLALTKKLVEAQRGDITVESEPGKGSTFSVVLPRTGAKNEPASTS